MYVLILDIRRYGEDENAKVDAEGAKKEGMRRKKVKQLEKVWIMGKKMKT